MQKYCFNCMNLLGSSPFCGRCGCDSRAAEPSAAYHLPRGTMLANRYIIGKTLGEGGFGIHQGRFCSAGSGALFSQGRRAVFV